MKILVLGGTGWLGHHIVMILEKAGHQVTSASRGLRHEKYETNPEKSELVTVDKKNESQMRELLARRYEVIIDTVPQMESIGLIAKYAVGLRHYLHCSSTGGYTPLPFLPCDETAVYHGDAGQGWFQKAVVDAEVMRRYEQDGFPATVIRPCYITGGGDKLPLDNLGGRRENFIPDILAGKKLEIPDNGLALLQPIHVEDLAASFQNALENRRSIGQIYNICLEHAVTLKRYLEINAEALSRRLELEYVPLAELLVRHPEDPVGLKFVAMHMCFTIAKAKAEIGYAPRHTTEETIAETAVKTAAKTAK